MLLSTHLSPRAACLNAVTRNSRSLASSAKKTTHSLPLEGIRVLELGQLIAGPFAGQLLGQFGAEVIKVEPPNGGDPLRVWRELDEDGTSPWFRSLGRNKKSITIDLRQERGRSLVKKLAIKSDVLLENFRPGTLEKWGLCPMDLHPHNPDLIFTRVSGYGQTGPWAARGGYASVCEAESGFRYINGFADPETGMLYGPPVRPNISLGDSVAGLHAAFGTVLAILSRIKRKDDGTGTRGGQTVDVSILDSMLNLMEGIIPEYDRKGTIRGPSGSSVTGIVPTNAYPTSSPSAYIVIGGNGDSIYTRLMTAIGRTDLTGPKYLTNAHRVTHRAEIEQAISDWTSKHTPEEVCAAMEEAKVPNGRIMNVEDILACEHLWERGMVEEVDVNGEWRVKMSGVAPRLEGGGVETTAGPDLGVHDREVFVEELGLSEAEMAELREGGVIA